MPKNRVPAAAVKNSALVTGCTGVVRQRWNRYAMASSARASGSYFSSPLNFVSRFSGAYRR